jgi:monoamine oxidase
LPRAHRSELDSIGAGQAAKLFIPAGGVAEPSAVMNVPERYWTWTATGAGGRIQQVVCAFAGDGGLARLRVADGPDVWTRSVAALRPDLVLDPQHAVLSTWEDDPWSRCAYCTPSPGEAEPRALAAGLPRIAFCGEHLGGEFRGLMEGALRSGRRAALSWLAAAVQP